MRPSPTKTLRADAQENRKHLLEVAGRILMKKGPDASMEEIARRAGVGIGTLYRHFPTRQDLVETVYASQIEALIDKARELVDTLSPREALVAWLRATADHMTSCRALKAYLIAARGEGAPSPWHERLRAAGDRVLSAAEKAGVVRPGLETMDLMRLVHGITVAAEKSADSARQLELFLGILIDGLMESGRERPAG